MFLFGRGSWRESQHFMAENCIQHAEDELMRQDRTACAPYILDIAASILHASGFTFCTYGSDNYPRTEGVDLRIFDGPGYVMLEYNTACNGYASDPARTAELGEALRNAATSAGVDWPMKYFVTDNPSSSLVLNPSPDRLSDEAINLLYNTFVPQD